MGTYIADPASGDVLLLALHLRDPALDPLARRQQRESPGLDLDRAARRSPGCRPAGSLPITRAAATVVGHMAGPDPRRRLLPCRDSEFSGAYGSLERRTIPR